MVSDLDPARSRMMASIRSRDTTPELKVRRALFARGFRYRVNVKKLPGSPDLVFPGRRAVVLVHGCFWHSHQGCHYFRLPKTRTEFWSAKLAANAARDARDVERLRALGWRVAVVWECATRQSPDIVAGRLAEFLDGSVQFLDISV